MTQYLILRSCHYLKVPVRIWWPVVKGHLGDKSVLYVIQALADGNRAATSLL